MTSDTKNALQQAAQLAQDYLSDVAERPVGVPVDLASCANPSAGRFPRPGRNPPPSSRPWRVPPTPAWWRPPDRATSASWSVGRIRLLWAPTG